MPQCSDCVVTFITVMNQQMAHVLCSTEPVFTTALQFDASHSILGRKQKRDSLHPLFSLNPSASVLLF